MPGTTMTQLKPHDVVIRIDLATYILDKGVAYLAKNGVILFPNKVPKRSMCAGMNREERGQAHSKGGATWPSRLLLPR